jgi:hypothetical protein
MIDHVLGKYGAGHATNYEQTIQECPKQVNCLVHGQIDLFVVFILKDKRRVENELFDQLSKMVPIKV